MFYNVRHTINMTLSVSLLNKALLILLQKNTFQLKKEEQYPKLKIIDKS